MYVNLSTRENRQSKGREAVWLLPLAFAVALRACFALTNPEVMFVFWALVLPLRPYLTLLGIWVEIN